MVSSAWLFGEKVVVAGLTLIVGIVLARYLGPDQFGILNFAMATVAIASRIAALGLGGGVVVRHLIEDPNAAEEVIGTALMLRLVASLLLMVVTIILAGSVGISQPAVIAVVALTLPFEAFATLRLLFEARVSSQHVVTATILSTAAGVALTVVAVYQQSGLGIFAILLLVQAVITATALAIAFNRFGLPLNRLKFKWDRALGLVGESWPLILSAAGAILYLKLDQIMLGEMVGMSEVGVYSVAARISEAWYILPTVLGVSIAPRLLELRASNSDKYELRLKQAFRYSFWLGIAIALCVSLVATPLMVLLYGVAYKGAGIILSIHIWTCPLVFIGVILQKWFLAERLLVQSFTRHLLGAVINVALNLWLIPLWGAVGAAVATLISYSFASFFGCFLTKRTRSVGVWMIQAIRTPQLMLSGRGSP